MLLTKKAKVVGLVEVPKNGYAKVITLDAPAAEPMTIHMGLDLVKEKDVKMFDTVEVEYSKDASEAPTIKRVLLEDREAKPTLNRMV
ncbi:MAG: hypothetical protein IKL58_00265 [Phascolarctobacterium sp.]|nr:hypothetical protein [Phascolarctobacterium sp.]